LLWILTGSAIICLWWRNRSAAVVFSIALTVPLALDFVPYIFTAMPFSWHVENSIGRLVLQLVPVAVAAIGMAFAAERTCRVSTAEKESMTSSSIEAPSAN
jgi:hypothetical protein